MMNALALELLHLSEHMASVATRLRAVGRSIELESHADELMAEAASMVALAETMAAGTEPK